jgi:hypothetical protein
VAQEKGDQLLSCISGRADHGHFHGTRHGEIKKDWGGGEINSSKAKGPARSFPAGPKLCS